MRKSKEHFRHEWKYLINRAEKQLTDLRLRECMQLDPHAGEGGYMIRSLYLMITGTVPWKKRMQVY